MKLIEYVNTYRKWHDRTGMGHEKVSALHGERFYAWFDRTFGLKPL
jgi:hypothetical protein